MPESTVRGHLERAQEGLRRSNRNGWEGPDHFMIVDQSLTVALAQLSDLERDHEAMEKLRDVRWGRLELKTNGEWHWLEESLPRRFGGDPGDAILGSKEQANTATKPKSDDHLFAGGGGDDSDDE